jgi:rubrerythrin
MNFESLVEILKYAIEKEKEAAEFYLEISRQESFAGARETFEQFAAEERKHQVLLEKFDYMVDIEYEKGMHYTDILRLAMKREEKALKLYNELQTKIQGEAYLKLFKILAQEEAKHKRALETLYDDYMADQGD